MSDRAAGAARNHHVSTDAPLSPWAPLRYRIFRGLFIAQLASNLGSLMQAVAAAWMVGDLGGSPTLVAMVQTATFLPVFVVGIPAGALADVIDRRKLLIATQLWMMATATLLAVLAFLDTLTPASILALTFSLGLGVALNTPAFQALQPDLVPPREFSQAVALNAMSYNLGRSVGPALGGFIVAAAGPGWVFLLNAVSFTGILAVVWRLRPTRGESQLPSETLTGATRAGLRYAANSTLLRAVLVRVGLYMLPFAALQALLPIVVRGELDLGSGWYGVLLGCFGIGAAGAAVLRPRIERHVSSDEQAVAAIAITAAALLVQGFVRQPVALGAALFVTGVTSSTAVTSMGVAAQAVLPAWVRARGMSLYTLVMTGSIAFGSLVWGAIASRGIELAHLIASGVMAAGILAVRKWPLRLPPTLDMTAVLGDAPIVAFIPEPADGPVLVTVAYSVPHDEVEEFAKTMLIVERLRRSTGAYRWGLFRDLAQPDDFVESFLVRSWAEHLHQHQRHTATSEAFLQRLSAYVVRERPVGHYISTYSPGVLAEHEAHPELDDLVENT